MNRHPSFTSILVSILVVTRSMLRSVNELRSPKMTKVAYQDRDANHTIGINCTLGFRSRECQVYPVAYCWGATWA